MPMYKVQHNTVLAIENVKNSRYSSKHISTNKDFKLGDEMLHIPQFRSNLLLATNVKCTLHQSALDPTNATHSPQTSSALLHLSGDGTKNKAK